MKNFKNLSVVTQIFIFVVEKRVIMSNFVNVTLEDLRRPVSEELSQFEKYFSQSIEVSDPYVRGILAIVFRKRGKQLRPLLTLLSAALHAKPTHRSLVAATLIELMHTASLVHDDVIDEAYHRRGEFSANALFRGKKSVLIGDFILARMMKIMSSEAGPELLAATSRVVEQLCEGELLQMEHVEMLSNDRESYERIIRGKTGVLLGLCSEAGALSVGANAEQCNTMRQFGEQLGIAFQIKDDLLDYSKTEITGKFSCNDIIEQKITLPMIYLLNNCDSGERRKVLRMLSRVKRNPENAQILRQMVEESGGLNYATECMCEIRDKALTLLDSYPQSTVKDALIGFSDFILTRDK